MTVARESIDTLGRRSFIDAVVVNSVEVSVITFEMTEIVVSV